VKAPKTIDDFVAELPPEQQEAARVWVLICKMRRRARIKLRDPAYRASETARLASERRLADAWKGGSDVQFGNALHLAVNSPSRARFAKKLLEDHIAAHPLADPNDRAMLAGYLRKLQRRIDQLEPRKPGRPPRNPDKAQAIEQAERYAARLVRWKQAQWRRKYHRERVPAAETDTMIQEAKPEAAREFKVPVWKISEVSIRNALKSGRFSVR